MSSAVKEKDEKYDPVKKDNCAICMEPLSDYTNGIALNIHTTGAHCDKKKGHFFHSNCITGWFKEKSGDKECPLCKCPIDYARFTEFMDQLKIVEDSFKHKQKDRGARALYTASANGQLEFVNALLERGAPVDAVLTDGTTPLYIASANGHLDVVNALLEKGPYVDYAKSDHTTPLCIAIKNNHLEVVEALLAQGAEVNVVLPDGWTPLMHATDTGNLRLMKVLLANNADVNYVRKKDGLTPLLSICMNKDAKYALDRFLPLLLKKGANVNYVRQKDGLTPLMQLIYINGPTKMLLDYDADVNGVTKNGWTPLCYACELNRSLIVEELLLKDAAVDAAMKNGQNPLLIASAEGYVDVVKALLKFGANVNVAKQEGGYTPLMYAIDRGKVDMVKMLLEKGADVKATTGRGEAPLEFAVSKDNYHIAQLIIEAIKEEYKHRSLDRLILDKIYRAMRLARRLRHVYLFTLLEKSFPFDDPTAWNSDVRKILVIPTFISEIPEVIKEKCNEGSKCSVQGGTRRRRKVIRKSRGRKSRKSMR